VDHVDIDLYEGEVVSIVANQQCKTTFAKLLLGLINTTEGNLLPGKKRDMRTQRREGILENIQAIFQIVSSYNIFTRSILCFWIVLTCARSIASARQKSRADGRSV